jgi:hypothetical protein
VKGYGWAIEFSPAFLRHQRARYEALPEDDKPPSFDDYLVGLRVRQSEFVPWFKNTLEREDHLSEKTVDDWSRTAHFMVSHPDCDLNAQHERLNGTLFSYLVKHAAPVSVLQAAINAGADVNVRFYPRPWAPLDSVTPIGYATGEGTAQLLVDNGANLSRPGTRNQIVEELTQKCWSEAQSHFEQDDRFRFMPHPDMTREGALLLANLNHHHRAFSPHFWEGNEEKALSLIAQLPPFLQEELSMQAYGLRQQAELFAEKPVRGWAARVEMDDASIQARAL